jgi:Obg family GTPase CgtA-like protein
MVRLGVEKAMRKNGVATGDIVRIGEMEFEYSDDLG